MRTPRNSAETAASGFMFWISWFSWCNQTIATVTDNPFLGRKIWVTTAYLCMHKYIIYIISFHINHTWKGPKLCFAAFWQAAGVPGMGTQRCFSQRPWNATPEKENFNISLEHTPDPKKHMFMVFRNPFTLKTKRKKDLILHSKSQEPTKSETFCLCDPVVLLKGVDIFLKSRHGMTLAAYLHRKYNEFLPEKKHFLLKWKHGFRQVWAGYPSKTVC